LSIAPLVAAILTKSAPSSRIRAFLNPLPPPLLNYNQNFLKYEFQTSWCAESRCHIYLSIAPLFVQVLQWKSAPIFEDSEHFCSPTLRQLWTTIRTSWKMNARPVWCAESHCYLHLSIARMVVALQWKVGSDFFWVFLSTTAPPLWTTIRTSWNMVSGPL
jgi:hypothetical protein